MSLHTVGNDYRKLRGPKRKVYKCGASVPLWSAGLVEQEKKQHEDIVVLNHISNIKQLL